MQQIRTQIQIDAAPEKIWETLMNFDAYPEWNPLVRKIEGEAKRGAGLKIQLQLEGMKPMHFSPRIRVLEPRKEFRWLGKMFIPRIFDGEHYFKLEAQPDGSTLFIHGEKFRGILVGLIMRKIKKATLQGFENMNAALKARCEAPDSTLEHA